MNVFELLILVAALVIGSMLGHYFFLHFGWWGAIGGGIPGFAIVPLLLAFISKVAAWRRARPS